MKRIIDAHIHLDQYEDGDIGRIIADLERIECTNLISVSSHLDSCLKNLALVKKYKPVKPAFGFHPEQALPSDSEMTSLFTWIAEHKEDMVAIGEIGLPYYLRMKAGNGTQFPLDGYIELLEKFLKYARKWDKPVILHAVYDDAPIVCDLLEKYSIEKAHFHWFKGEAATTQRIIENGYYISVTPDVLYEQEIQNLVKLYPLEKMMVETDGPWKFKGKFENQITHPKMIHSSVSKISQIKEIDLSETYHALYMNSNRFFSLKT
ncbi:TatD family hydrolase [Sporosarcina jiandibaonis]|uniref:TatD family hydrolase n=1 Tax=Sporosarcina jiandibaonis TaxID=2715535 RepID=UPI001555B19D|nr:TatD family hydrolase [Sporosarcina jiandibaonis]